MTAPELSPEEAAIVARFDAAPVPPEVVVETVAQAICRSLDSDDPNDWTPRTLAAAAIAAMPPSPAEEAIKRVEALAESLDWETAERRRIARATPCCGAADRIRAALASPAPAPEAKSDGMGEGVQ